MIVNLDSKLHAYFIAPPLSLFISTEMLLQGSY